MRFAKDFHSWLRHTWKLLANRLTRNPKIVIHGNSCIILYIYTHIHILYQIFVRGHTKINNWGRPVMTIHRVERDQALMSAIHKKCEKYPFQTSKIAGTSWKVYRCCKRRNNSLKYMGLALLLQPNVCARRLANDSTYFIWNRCQNMKT